METPRYIIEYISSNNEEATKIFLALPSSHQQEYVTWIDSAKKEETRNNRLEKMLTMILDKSN